MKMNSVIEKLMWNIKEWMVWLLWFLLCIRKNSVEVRLLRISRNVMVMMMCMEGYGLGDEGLEMVVKYYFIEVM